MERTAPVVGDPKGRDEIRCESYGYTIGADQVWRLPETGELFIYQFDAFRPYDGPVIHGTGYTF